MIFKTIVPLLYSENISRSLAYYVNVLGFDRSWDYGEPPDFGAVIKDTVEIFFSTQLQKGPGGWTCLVVDAIDEYYEAIKARNAKILSAPQTMEWGMREMVVEDPDGNKMRVGQPVVSARDRSHSEATPATLRIVSGAPAEKEIQQLLLSSGEVKKIPSAAVTVFIAEDTVSGKAVGAVSLFTNGNGFYYIKDLAVKPEWQGKGIGSMLMKELTRWLENNAPANSTAWLHSAENLSAFYKQFGFGPVFGMYRPINPGKEQ